MTQRHRQTSARDKTPTRDKTPAATTNPPPLAMHPAVAGEGIAEAVLDALPFPVLLIDQNRRVAGCNAAAEAFFETSRAVMRRNGLDALLSPGSPIVALVAEAGRREAAISEYRIPIDSRSGDERVVDAYVMPLGELDALRVLVLQERTIAEKIDRHLTQRGAARSVTALGQMLAHEIKNPLSGISGAAQLLESTVSDGDRILTRLIRDEADRIVKLVDRFEHFGDAAGGEREAVNIHTVLDHVKRLASSGFARHIRLVESYDPSLPPVHANRDQLVQLFLNLVKNAAEAIGPDAVDGEIELSTAYRPGVRFAAPGAAGRVVLPLEIGVRDNGPGIRSDLLPRLFDPFVTTKASGTGLGLAMVATIAGDHGGLVECESRSRRTTFRVLMPMHAARDGRSEPA